MNKHAVKAAALTLAMLLAPAFAQAAEVTLLISNALIKYFAAPDAARMMRANGLEPAV